jgi:ATP-dependent Zn protease
LAEAYDKSKDIIEKNKSNIESMAEVLFEKEYLTREEFESMMKDISNAKKLMKDIIKK